MNENNIYNKSNTNIHSNNIYISTSNTNDSSQNNISMNIIIFQ